MPRLRIIALVSALLLAAGLFLPGLAASHTEGENWSLISGDFGEGARAIYSSVVYNSQLYIDIGSVNGCEVWRFDGGTHWSKVNESGFGDPLQAVAWSMVVHDSTLYVGTSCDVMPDILSRYNGCQVWCYDGATWTRVNTDGFGDPNNDVIGQWASSRTSFTRGQGTPWAVSIAMCGATTVGPPGRKSAPSTASAGVA